MGGLGQLKKEADKYHAETNANLEKELKKIKKQNAELKQQVQTLRSKQKHILKNQDFERDEAPANVKKKLKSMVMPIRGGGKKKKPSRKKGRKKSAMNTNDLHAMPPQTYNNYHAKSPSMMNPGFMSTPQTMLYQSQFEMDGMQQDDILDGNIPEIPAMGPGMANPGMATYFSPSQPVYDPHARQNTFM